MLTPDDILIIFPDPKQLSERDKSMKKLLGFDKSTGAAVGRDWRGNLYAWPTLEQAKSKAAKHLCSYRTKEPISDEAYEFILGMTFISEINTDHINPYEGPG